MKNNLILVLLLMSSITFSQEVIIDTLYIKFNENKDFKKTVQNILFFEIENSLFKKELERYNKLVNKNRIRPLPLPVYKPQKFYSYHSIGNYFEKEVRKMGPLKYYDKNKLNVLSPYNKVILIVENRGCSYRFSPVSFYPNILE